MEELITDFLVQFKNLDDNIHIKPKAHYMVHYATQYRVFGPLINFSTLRFEGKHSNLKSIFAKCKNYRNPCLTIATRHQYLQALHHMNENFLVTDIEPCNKGATIALNMMDKSISNEISPIIGEESTITLREYICISGITYRRGLGVLIGYDVDYLFGIIENVFSHQNKLYLIIQLTSVKEYNSHIHSYVIENSNKFCVKCVDVLYNKMPLSIYKSSHNMCQYISLNHI
jgi:hypothetical protein